MGVTNSPERHWAGKGVVSLTPRDRWARMGPGHSKWEAGEGPDRWGCTPIFLYLNGWVRGGPGHCGQVITWTGYLRDPDTTAYKNIRVKSEWSLTDKTAPKSVTATGDHYFVVPLLSPRSGTTATRPRYVN